MIMLKSDFSKILTDRQDELAEAIVRQQYQRQNTIWAPFGSVGQQKSLRDAKYHLAYLIEAVDSASPDLFFDYVAWVKVLFSGLGFPESVLHTTLECTYTELAKLMGDEALPLLDTYVEAAIEKLDQTPDSPPLFVNPNLPLGGLAKEYLDALLSSNRNRAVDLIMHAVDSNTPIQDIYLHVFQPVQREVGRLWQTNQISVAQEHYCTAVTQMTMSQLYPHIFGTNRIGKKMVATSVGGELHEVGVRMVADFFEMAGWDTYYLGANTPLSSILSTIEEQSPDVLGISATITYHLPKAEEIIRQVRAQFGDSAPSILVGGYPFLIDNNLWKTIGADGFGRDAQEALDVSHNLLN